MTVQDVEEAAAGFTFVGGLSDWTPKLSVQRGTRLPVLWIEIYIPNSGAPGERRWLASGEEVSSDRLAVAALEGKTPQQYVADFLARFFLHEMYESILVGGERLFDPHVAEKYHPGAL